MTGPAGDHSFGFFKPAESTTWRWRGQLPHPAPSTLALFAPFPSPDLWVTGAVSFGNSPGPAVVRSAVSSGGWMVTEGLALSSWSRSFSGTRHRVTLLTKE